MCNAPSLLRLFGPLVDLAEEGLEDLLLETLGLIHGRNLGPQLTHHFLLVLLVQLLQLQLVEDLLHLGLLLLVLAAVGIVEHLALLGSAALDGLVDQPRALVVLDIGANLADNRGVTEVVQVVVLDLEVLTQGDKDVVGLLEVLLGGDLQVVHSQSHGQVEAIVGGLVGDDEHVLVHGEVVQVDIVLGGGDQIAELAQLGLPGDLVEELDDVDVGGVRAEALLQDEVDGPL